MTQDLLNGRPASIERAGQNAMMGKAFGKIANKAAATYAENIPGFAKGPIGEALGAVRAIADWKPRVAKGNTPVKIPGTNAKWKPDAMRGEDIHAPDAYLYEDKFGRTARPSKGQLLAQAALGENFQLNHFMPRDFGMAASALAAALGIQASERSRSPQTKR